MDYVTVNDFRLLQKELKQMNHDIREIRYALIPEVKISAKERKELDAIYKEMSEGKATPWREVRKQLR